MTELPLNHYYTKQIAAYVVEGLYSAYRCDNWRYDIDRKEWYASERQVELLDIQKWLDLFKSKLSEFKDVTLGTQQGVKDVQKNIRLLNNIAKKERVGSWSCEEGYGDLVGMVVRLTPEDLLEAIEGSTPELFI